jgi:hypothetical protein
MKTERRQRIPIKDQITQADLNRLKDSSIFADNRLYVVQSEGNPDKSIQRKITVGGKQLPLSHYVLWLTTGELPDRVVHLDGNHYNCRPENLRPVFYGAEPDESAEVRRQRRVAAVIQAISSGELDVDSLPEATREALLRQLSGRATTTAAGGKS